MTQAYVGLGSNLGDRLGHLQGAVDALATTDGIFVVAVSDVYETAPVGGPVQVDFLNAVVKIETDLRPRELLAVAMHVERLAARVRIMQWGPRTLDVDILLYGDDEIREPDLEIPHPRMHERPFVLAPLLDVAPERVTQPDGGWEGVTNTPLALRLP